jgi:hypothetical protein
MERLLSGVSHPGSWFDNLSMPTRRCDVGASEAEAIEVWLRTPAGRARLHAALDRRRLPHALADDLAQDVLVAALLAPGPIEEPAAWATVVAARRAVDLLRARARRPVAELEPWIEPVEASLAPEDAVVGHLGVADDARRALAGVVPVAVRSAALTAVTVAVDGVALPRDCPQPGRGAAAADAPLWAGVWFAGGHDCWAEPDTPAVRKRRSRAVAAARDALAAVTT